jgi:hypothetical protein
MIVGVRASQKRTRSTGICKDRYGVGTEATAPIRWSGCSPNWAVNFGLSHILSRRAILTLIFPGGHPSDFAYGKGGKF